MWKTPESWVWKKPQTSTPLCNRISVNGFPRHSRQGQNANHTMRNPPPGLHFPSHSIIQSQLLCCCRTSTSAVCLSAMPLRSFSPLSLPGQLLLFLQFQPNLPYFPSQPKHLSSKPPLIPQMVTYLHSTIYFPPKMHHPKSILLM